MTKSATKKTPEAVRAMLRTLKPNPLRGRNRISEEQIITYCMLSGRPFVNPANLAAYLRTL
jgi:hypothetical protein